MNLKEFLTKYPKTKPFSIPLGFNKENYLVSFDLTRHGSYISFGDNYDLIKSMVAYTLLKNSPDKLKLIIYSHKDTTLSQFRNMPHTISYLNGADMAAPISIIQWATDEIERRKCNNLSRPRILLAIFDGNPLFFNDKFHAQNLHEMLNTISSYGAEYGINLLTDKASMPWGEENKLLEAFSGWLTIGGTYEDSQRHTGNKYTFSNMEGSYYKPEDEKPEIIQQIKSSDYDILDLMPNLKTLKPHEYDNSIGS